MDIRNNIYRIKNITNLDGTTKHSEVYQGITNSLAHIVQLENWNRLIMRVSFELANGAFLDPQTSQFEFTTSLVIDIERSGNQLTVFTQNSIYYFEKESWDELPILDFKDLVFDYLGDQEVVFILAPSTSYIIANAVYLSNGVIETLNIRPHIGTFVDTVLLSSRKYPSLDLRFYIGFISLESYACSKNIKRFHVLNLFKADYEIKHHKESYLVKPNERIVIDNFEKF